MIPFFCALIWWTTAALAVGCFYFPKIVGPLTLVLFLYLAWFAYQSYGDAEVHSADNAARILYEAQAGKTPNLPDSMKGVFWMEGNAAPELLITMEGSEYDEERKELRIMSGAPLNWSYNTGKAGWIYWAFLRFSYLLCARLRVRFDPECLQADMPLYLFSCIWAPMGMVWTMKYVSDGVWERNINLYWKPKKKWNKGSYTLRRVIDADGRETPAFAEMMAVIESGEKVKGWFKKTPTQIINGKPGGGACCGLLPGPDAWRVYQEKRRQNNNVRGTGDSSTEASTDDSSSE
eukprot:CAMPEP_0206588738 /NCGR_PEP_ID=MMETSP0325_2-20121206/38478_1 /ASSEMBLY_ACC=CAM_ASM_000347 /TAXON_ID=2866 /ORGANISM="Crypthecodinium cohnii, Strain Seligo" /LENGTH=290 /DNA_ID=CAMNT_0054097107 /DNA_START=168 /DNA_END=1037 /DNA_ORIENTATION=-